MRHTDGHTKNRFKKIDVLSLCQRYLRFFKRSKSKEKAYNGCLLLLGEIELTCGGQLMPIVKVFQHSQPRDIYYCYYVRHHVEINNYSVP